MSPVWVFKTKTDSLKLFLAFICFLEESREFVPRSSFLFGASLSLLTELSQLSDLLPHRRMSVTKK